jgi:FkbM family methyltransferase
MIGKRTCVQMVEKVLPKRLVMRARYAVRRFGNRLDPELFLLDGLLEQRRGFVDIGANVGLYTYFFSRTFERIYSFEPIREKAPPPGKWNRARVSVFNVALSDQKGSLHLYIPEENGSLETTLASVEPREGPCEVREVAVETLDAFGLQDIDLMKIDVEGHERQVIAGALNTIRNHRPLLLIEIEQRHSPDPIQQVFDQITGLGYQGYYVQGSDMHPIGTFSYEEHQKPFLDDVYGEGYVNNFIFQPDPLAGEVHAS